MKALQKYTLLAVLAGAVLAGCRNDDDEPCCDPTNPECPNYDPCHGKMETSARFTIAQQLGGIGEEASIFVEDDVVTGGTLKFSATPQEGAMYTWILGADTIVGGPEVTIPLGSLPNGTYNNSLIVHKEADTLCFPNDTGQDQFFRAFTKISGCDAAILGRYRGVFNLQPNDSVEIEFARSTSVTQILPCSPTATTNAVFFVNCNMQGDSIVINGTGGVNRKLTFGAFGSLDRPEGFAYLDIGLQHITSEYTIDDVPFVFNGIKL